MFTASQKKKDNIAEYLLYMWQIEDLIRAYNLDIDRIQAGIIDRYEGLTDEQRKQLRDWYESLIDMMRREGVEKSGHLQINKNVILSLEDLHRRLMADSRFPKYNAEFYNILPYIVELRAKSGDVKPSEIEAGFNALYGLLLLKLQNKEISSETLEASRQISHFLGSLAAYYKKDYNNELFND